MSTDVNEYLRSHGGAGLWSPPPYVTDHNHRSLAPDCDFFVAPPVEIGEIRTAHTSLKKGMTARPVPVRLAIAAAWGVGGYVVVLMVNRVTSLLFILSGLTRIYPFYWTLLLSFIPAFIAWRKMGFKHFCQFVGDEGCAQFQCKGARENVSDATVFCFKDAAALSTSMIRHFRNGIYQYTNFYFNWYPPDSEKAVFGIGGSHSADMGEPPAGNPYSFLRSAESAWYDYLIPRADAELAANGYIRFHMGHKRWARVGPGFLEIEDKDGAVHRCEAADIGSARLSGGAFKLTRKDAESPFFGLLGSTGIFEFDYGNMYNGRLFLFVFEKFLGIKLS